MARQTPAEPRSRTGEAGEIHQQAGASALTTPLGVSVADDQNSLRAGARGPTLMEDQILREKLFHFDHERIPERVVHARGFGFRSGSWDCRCSMRSSSASIPSTCSMRPS